MKNKYSLQDWLFYIENLNFQFVDLSLSRIQDIALELDVLHPAKIVILVGGTNGKGTTCCLLESILLAHGVQVGVYSSPHLLSYTERLRINGEELTESKHVEAMNVIEGLRSSRLLTYFEFSTLSNLYLLKNKKLDVVILEVGLGGRFDATNVVDPDISIITNVAFDHTDILGVSYMSIAKEKFGIFRPGKPAIVGDFYHPKILRNVLCNDYKAIPLIKNEDWWFIVEGNKWSWWNREDKLSVLPIPKIPIDNAAIVMSAICCLPLNIARQSINYALNTAVLPGRFQIVARCPCIVLDVAHNPHAAFYLSQRLKMLDISGNFRMVVGMLKNKNIFGTLHALDDLMPIWYFSSLSCASGASSFEISSCVKDYSFFQEFSSVSDAFYQAFSDSCYEDCIVVFGSFHTVSPILRLINKEINFSEQI